MAKVVREKYENGVLVERTVEVTGIRPGKWVRMMVQVTVAISLAVLAFISVHDSLTLRSTMMPDVPTDTSCEVPRVRS